jgi:osmotically-inducible protein OsmY
MKNSLSLPLVALLSLGLFSVATGCQNTAEGMKEDSQVAGQKAAESAEKTSEAVSKSSEAAGEKMAKMADNASKSAKELGQDLTGAFQVTPIVKTALAADTELNDAKNKIDVDSKDGIVHLKGHVTSNALKQKATRIAQERIKENHGIDKVMNHLLIQP